MEEIQRIISCPICKKSTVWSGNKFRPFCSQRCVNYDLGNWSDSKYTVPVVEYGEEEIGLLDERLSSINNTGEEE